jgi:hypothetical protein
MSFITRAPTDLIFEVGSVVHDPPGELSTHHETSLGVKLG